MLRRTRQLLMLIVVVILMIGVNGCMGSSKSNKAEEIKKMALEYLDENYDDEFVVLEYSPNSWFNKYSSVTFTAEKYLDSVIEVRVYKNNDGTYTFKDNYFKYYMQNDAITYFENFLKDVCSSTVKIRFLDTIWSDELGKNVSFNDWKNEEKCSVDVFFVTQQKLGDGLKKAIVNNIAMDKISGAISFIETTDIDVLSEYQIDDILNDQGNLVNKKSEYYINDKFEITSYNDEQEDVFARMSQEDKQEYLLTYLREAYKAECTLYADIKKREINSFSSEEHYYAIAQKKNNEDIYCWISDDGIIIDSKFILDMTDEITSIFKSKIDLDSKEYKIECYTTLNEVPIKKWDKSEAQDMLEKESVTADVRVFVNTTARAKIRELIQNDFYEKLNFTNGFIFFYYIKDLEELNINDINLMNYDDSYKFKKE